ncbi:Hypothetical protein FKW44_024466 [Caligus rogercresseyi]|uniref:Uncharacterized protein n=1 Tax=Caligus rogercresseyi TaxID=217165 RepID=A0A7T8JTV9_CALRO|nr:Hypothetical protein FKW44_024593 [Caligus rogercresseyi]QQP33176.1 Hypothetical protein FKW44_024466 [Caligus rogercresseyi]
MAEGTLATRWRSTYIWRSWCGRRDFGDARWWSTYIWRLWMIRTEDDILVP